MTPLILLTVGEILVAFPLSCAATLYFWRLYGQDRSGLKLVLAVKSTAFTVAGGILAVPTLFFIAGIPLPFSGQLVLVSLDILLPTGAILAAYLRWLDR